MQYRQRTANNVLLDDPLLALDTRVGRRRSTRPLTAPVRMSRRLRLPDDPLSAPDACVAQEGFGRAVVGAWANKCGVLLV